MYANWIPTEAAMPITADETAAIDARGRSTASRASRSAGFSAGSGAAIGDRPALGGRGSANGVGFGVVVAGQAGQLVAGRKQYVKEGRGETQTGFDPVAPHLLAMG